MFSNTIDVINKYRSLIGLDHNPSIDEKNFVYNFPLEFSKSILNDFDKDTVRKLGKFLTIMTE